MKTSIFIQVFAGFVINLIGQSGSIESTAHEWNSLAIEQTEYGEKRAIFQGRSDGFDYVDANAITLGGMTSTPWVHVPKDFEELLIIKEGTVQYVTNQKSDTLGAGSVVSELLTRPNKFRVIGSRPRELKLLHIFVYAVTIPLLP